MVRGTLWEMELLHEALLALLALAALLLLLVKTSRTSCWCLFRYSLANISNHVSKPGVFNMNSWGLSEE